MLPFVLLGVGVLVLLLSVGWRHELAKASAKAAVDAAFDSAGSRRAKLEQLATSFERERHVAEWIGAIGAIAMAVGAVWSVL